MDIKEIIDYSIKNNGITLNVNLERINAKNGFMISITNFEIVLPCDKFNEEITKQFITDMIKQINILGSKNHYIGIFINDNKIYFDISIRILEFENALKIGKENDQIAIWDNARMQEIILKR